MPLIRPEYSKNIRQLQRMQDDLHRARQGNPRSRKMWLAVFVFVAFSFAIDALGSHFQVKLPLFWYLLAAIIFLVVTFRRIKNESWDDILLKKLTEYSPVNLQAYEDLRTQVREKNDLNWDDLRYWISEEKYALYEHVEIKNEALTNFLQKPHLSRSEFSTTTR